VPGFPGPARGRADSEWGRGSAAPEGLLVAGVAGQGLMMADLGLRGCLHKAGYTNGLGWEGALNFLSAQTNCAFSAGVKEARSTKPLVQVASALALSASASRD
jgi:hypothetical protein